MHRTQAELEQGLEAIRRSPADGGRVELLVCRPAVGERAVLETGLLDLADGLVGDCWRTRGNRHTPDGGADPEMQLNVMNVRAAALMAGPPERWPLAGDQLYLDLDLSPANLPPGTQLAIGTAVIEVTAKPHRGCVKFAERFGRDALRFVNSEAGRELNVRGINAKVVVPGAVSTGDEVRKADQPVSG